MERFSSLMNFHSGLVLFTRCHICREAACYEGSSLKQRVQQVPVEFYRVCKFICNQLFRFVFIFFSHFVFELRIFSHKMPAVSVTASRIQASREKKKG